MVSDHDLQKKLEKRLSDVNNLNNSNNNINEMVTGFKEKNHKSKKGFNNL